jgi:spermidine synthase
VALPGLDGLAAASLHYVAGPDGLLVPSASARWVAAACGAALILPPTLLMGGTLTLLGRHVVAHEVGRAGSRVGLLYALNTLGAAGGALLTDALLVPAVGIARTQGLAVALNALAGLAALALARRAAAARAPPTEPAAAPFPPRALGLAVGALGLSGFAAMGLEMLWFRFHAIHLGEFRAVFSLLLAMVLVGLWLGATLGGVLHRRWGRAGTGFLLAQGAMVATALLGLVAPPPTELADGLAALGARLRLAGPLEQAWLERAVVARCLADGVLVPAVLMGLSFPLVHALAQRSVPRVGAQAGLLYLGNTAGNVLGAAVTGFWLIPSLGVQGSALVLGAVATLSLLPVYLAARSSPDRGERPASLARAGLLGAGLALASLAGFARLPPGKLMAPYNQLAPSDRVLAQAEGLDEQLAVVELATGDRLLVTSGHPMSGTSIEGQRYMRAFAHLPLLQVDQPERALVICFGVGNTTSAVALHPLAHVEVVDLSRNVLAHAHWFARWNRDVLQDPRVVAHVNDGRHHLLAQPEGRYDLITLEPPPIGFGGVGALYSREFYALAKSRLKPGGFLTQWLPAYQVSEASSLALLRAFAEVFPESVLLSGHDNELILMGTTGRAIALDLEQVERNLAARPAVRAELETISLGRPVDRVGTFVGDAASMLRASAAVAPVTDDLPANEYGVVVPQVRTRMPVGAFDLGPDLAAVARWCPTCFAGGRPVAALAGLPDYLAVLAAYYQTERFQRFDSLPGAVDAPLPPVPAGQEATVDASPYLRLLFRGRRY